MASTTRLLSEGVRHHGLVLNSCGRTLALKTQRAGVPQQAARAASTKSKKSKSSGGKKQGKSNLPIAAAIDAVKGAAKARFDESVEMAIVLNVDPRKANQTVRGAVQLPRGTGKQVRVAVFAKGDDAKKAIEAGADIVGGEDLLQSILEGNMDFDKCVATPEMMPIVGRAGRVLGPRGLMPNAKTGSVTRDVENAIRLAKAGQANIRAGKNGVLHLGIGKVSFGTRDLLENVRATMVTVSNLKPEVIKGKYIQQVHLASTMGKAVPVDVATVDPSHSRFMLVDPTDASAVLETVLESQGSDAPPGTPSPQADAGSGGEDAAGAGDDDKAKMSL